MRIKPRQKKIDHWLVMCCSTIVVLIAFPIAAHFLGGKLLEPVATLWGSALGAFAAVAGALWIAERQSSEQRRRAAAQVLAMFYPLASALDQLSRVYGEPSRSERGESNEEPDVLSPEEWRSVNEHAGMVAKHYEKFKSKIHRYEAVLNLLSGVSLHMALDLESDFEDAVQGVVRQLALGSDSTAGHGITFYGGPAHWSSRNALMKANQQIMARIAVLSAEAA